MNQAMNRLFVRLGLLGLAIALGGLAVSQAQRGLSHHESGGSIEEMAALSSVPESASATDSPPASQFLQSIPDSVPAAMAGDPPAGYASVPVEPTAYAEAESGPPSAYASIPANDDYAAPPPPRQEMQAAGHPVAPVQYDLPPEHEGNADHYVNVPDVDEQLAADVVPAQAELPESTPTLASPESDATEGAAAPPSNLLPMTEVPEPPAASPNRLRPSPTPAAAPHEPATPPAEPSFDDSDDFGADADLHVHEDTGASAPANPFDADHEPAPERQLEDDSQATGIGQPGPEELQGPQSPSLTIRKSAPSEVQVGKPAKLGITVRNVGKIPAHDVVIRDEVPRGATLVDTLPVAEASGDGVVLWNVGTIEPNQEVSVTMSVMPTEEGELGSVATVSFQVAASARSVVTRPQLLVEQSGPQQVLVGQEVVFNIRLSNPGTGVATNVVLQEDVPEGLRHYDGRELEYQVGTLKPGETRILELKLTADKPGQVTNIVNARGDSNISVQDEWQLEVIAPDLQVAIEGPCKRFLERKATYQISVANPGTARADHVELVARLPQSLKFVGTNNSGRYDASRHSVVWNLEALPAQEMGTVELTTLPVQMGRFPIRVEAKAAAGLADAKSHEVEIEGIAALLFSVTDVKDPVEVGGETTYEVHVINQGSKTASNLRLAALIPAGMEPLRGDGPARVRIEGQKVLFEPLPRLAPQGDTIYRVFVRGTQPGDKRVQFKLVSDDVSQPVLSEASTFVYADE